MTERILLAEDDIAIAESVAYSLRASGYEVDLVDSGEAVLGSKPASYDLLVVDVRLPGLLGLSGVEVCRRVRAGSAVPVLMLTALTDEATRALGADAGGADYADDCLGKPFSMAELVRRVRAIVRRRWPDRSEQPAVTGSGRRLQLEPADQTVRVNGHRVELTPSEYRLLAMMAAEPGRVFGRPEISGRLARGLAGGDQRSCDVHIKNLRRKIEEDPVRPRRIVTVRGVGYVYRAV